jgi:hypothetical protein
MSYNRVMLLLSMIYSQADMEKREKIGDMFKQTVIKTEIYQNLKRVMQTTVFFGQDGIDLKSESESVLDDLVAEIYRSKQIIKQAELMFSKIEKELTHASEKLNSPSLFDTDLIAVDATTVPVFQEFYRDLASAICYYLLVHYGVKGIHNMTYNISDGFSGLVKTVNLRYISELLNFEFNAKPYVWAIAKASFTNDNLISFEGYRYFITTYAVSDSFKPPKEGDYKRLTPYLYFNSAGGAEILYLGIGNLVGTNAMKTLSFLESEIVQSLPNNAFQNDVFDYSNPLDEIRKSIDTDNYCISPEDFVKQLNRMKLIGTVENRKEIKRCIACGQQVKEGRIMCNDHVPPL